MGVRVGMRARVRVGERVRVRARARVQVYLQLFDLSLLAEDGGELIRVGLRVRMSTWSCLISPCSLKIGVSSSSPSSVGRLLTHNRCSMRCCRPSANLTTSGLPF